MLKKVLTSVIFKDVSFNIFIKNEPNSIQTKFHDFIMNLGYSDLLALNNLTIMQLGFQLIKLFEKKQVSCSTEI